MEESCPQPKQKQEISQEMLCQTCPFAMKIGAQAVSDSTAVCTHEAREDTRPTQEASLEERVARIRRDNPAVYRRIVAEALASIPADYWD